MKAEVKYSVPTKSETIDLTDYGHDENISWEDLTDEEQYEIQDSLREQQFIVVDITTMKDYC